MVPLSLDAPPKSRTQFLKPESRLEGGPAVSLRSLLAIDNDKTIVDYLRQGAGEAGFEVTTETSGPRALRRIAEGHFDAMVCDFRLGGMTGLDVVRKLREQNVRTATVLISGLRDQQVAVRAMKEGADDFVAKPFRISHLLERLETALARRAAFCSRLEAEHRLGEELQARESEIESLALRSIRSLVLSLEAKDRYTKDHSVKVALLAVRIARRLGLRDEEQRQVRLAGLLHDVGKIGVRESVLHKSGRLDDVERDHMEQHPVIGARILLPLANRFPEVVASVRHEHERWDGTGYPSKLKGEEIPRAARIIAVADCYDAMTSERPYRGAQSKEAAAAEIAAASGTQFDPTVVRAFLDLVSEI